MSRAIGTGAAAGCAVAMLAGCGLVSAVTSQFQSAPEKRANTDAASIVASFVPPPGAVSLGSAPAGLSSPMGTPASPDLVDKTAYWQANGAPEDVLGWEHAHLPSRFTWSGQGNSFGNGPAKSSETFTLPPVAGVLSGRTLEITAVPDGSRTDLRIDAQVTWLPSKPSSERVPAAAHAVTLTGNPGMDSTASPPHPVTVTSPATVSRLASLVNGLQPVSPGVMHCGLDTGQSVTLTFTAREGSPPLAKAVIALGGCGAVTFTVNGKVQQPALQSDNSGQQAMSIAGVRWPALSPTGIPHPPNKIGPKTG